MLVSPAWVSRDAGRSGSACRRVPTAILATAIGHRRVPWARPCGARTEDSIRVAPDASRFVRRAAPIDGVAHVDR